MCAGHACMIMIWVLRALAAPLLTSDTMFISRPPRIREAEQYKPSATTETLSPSRE